MYDHENLIGVVPWGTAMKKESILAVHSATCAIIIGGVTHRWLSVTRSL
jgi:hypothetical protein